MDTAKLFAYQAVSHTQTEILAKGGFEPLTLRSAGKNLITELSPTCEFEYRIWEHGLTATRISKDTLYCLSETKLLTCQPFIHIRKMLFPGTE